MMLRVVGNLCFGIALLLYLIPLPFMTSQPRTHDGGPSEAWGLILALLPLWFCLTLALCVSTANGALDWLSMGRGSQYAVVVVTCLAMAVVTGMSGLLRREPVDQIPWAVRPLVPFAWAMWVFIPMVLVFALLTINPGLGAGLPRLILRVPLGAVGGISLLVSFGLLAQWFISSQQRQAARVDAIVSAESERTKRDIEDVKGYDANTQLSLVLGYTNRYNDDKLRDLAIEKVRAVPDLEQQLIVGLHSEWREYVLIFLDAADPPDGKPLAEPARDAFLAIAEEARATVKDPSPLYPDSFDFRARLVLSVADKFRSYGVDYAPAIRAFRSALDEPRNPKIRFDCAATLDDWLRRDAKRGK